MATDLKTFDYQHTAGPVKTISSPWPSVHVVMNVIQDKGGGRGGTCWITDDVLGLTLIIMMHSDCWATEILLLSTQTHTHTLGDLWLCLRMCLWQINCLASLVSISLTNKLLRVASLGKRWHILLLQRDNSTLTQDMVCVLLQWRICNIRSHPVC